MANIPDEGLRPTDEQAAVIEAAKRPRGSLMIEAGAGCAKTSTMKMAAKGIKVPALGLAFNRRIADDLAKAVPANIQVKTMNGLGHGAWMRAVGAHVKLVLDERKLPKIIRETAQARKVKLKEDEWDDLRGLVRQAMASGLVPSSVGAEGLVEDSAEGWQAVAEAGGIEQAAPLVDLAREVLERSIEAARRGLISFDDQVYCSTMLGGKFQRYPMVLVDEDQDLSPLNIRMLGQSLASGGRLLAVGDRRQAIYAWRGAAGDSAERIRRLAPGADWLDLPLMTTFRCPKLIVARQQHHVPGFRAHEANKPGTVAVWREPAGPEAEAWGGWSFASIAAALPHPRASIAVLCRNNAPLVKLAMKLVRGRIGVQMLGRDIGKGLEKLVVKLSRDNPGQGVAELRAALAAWRDEEAELAAEYPSRLESVIDRAECLEAIASEGPRTAGEVTEAIRAIFQAESGLVTLGSIHRAKGLEWDFVLHLDPWRIPSKWAKEAAKAGATVALEQEWNLNYVAETRTKDTLVLASLADFRTTSGQ